MSSIVPPDLTIAPAAITTHANPGTQVGTAALPALAGQRYRVWFVQLHSQLASNTLSARGIVSIYVEDAAGARVGELVADMPSPDRVHVPGGAPLSVNSALMVYHRGELASQPVRVLVGYTVEDV